MARKLNWDKHKTGAGYNIRSKPLVDDMPDKDEMNKIYAHIKDRIQKGQSIKLSELPSAPYVFLHADKTITSIVYLPIVERFYHSGYYVFWFALEEYSVKTNPTYHVVVLSRVTGKQDDFCREATKTFTDRTEAHKHLNLYKQKAKERSKKITILEHLLECKGGVEHEYEAKDESTSS